MRNYALSDFTTHLPISSRELNLDKVLGTGQVFRWRKCQDTWYGVIREKVWVLRQEDPHLYYQAHLLRRQGGSGDVSETGNDVSALEHELRDYFNLKHKLGDISSGWKCDTLLTTLLSQHTGLRLIRQDPMECLLAFITSSCNNIPRISSLMLKLSALSDRQHTISDTTFHTLPHIALYQQDDIEQKLRNLGFGYRAKYITSAMRDVAERGGLQWLAGLREVELQTARAELISLAGVGPKVAACVCLMSLDKHAAVPVDTHIHQVAVKHYARADKALTPALHHQIESFFQEKHGHYAGWAQAYLFYSNSNKSNSSKTNANKSNQKSNSSKTKQKSNNFNQKSNKGNQKVEIKTKKETMKYAEEENQNVTRKSKRVKIK